MSYNSSSFVRSISDTDATEAAAVSNSKHFIGQIDGTIDVYNVSDGNFDQNLDPGIGNPNPQDIILSDGGEYLIAGFNSSDEGIVWWDTNDLDTANIINVSSNVQEIAISPDNGSIASAEGSAAELQIYDRSTGDNIAERTQGVGIISSVSWDPQGDYVAVADQYDGLDAFHLVSTDDWSLAVTISSFDNTDIGQHIQFIDGGNYFVGTAGEKLGVWDRNGTLVDEFTYSTTGVEPRRLSSAGIDTEAFAVSVHGDDVVDIYSVGESDGTGWGVIDTLDQSFGGNPGHSKWSPDDGHLVLGVGGDGSYLWDIESGVEEVEVVTEPATDVGDNEATLNGSLESIGSGDEADVWFDYKLSSDTTWSSTTTQTLTSAGSFSEQLSELEADTSYDFRAQSDGLETTDTGSTLTFTTGGLFDEWTPTWASDEEDWDVVSKTSEVGDAVLESTNTVDDRHALRWDEGTAGNMEILGLIRLNQTEDILSNARLIGRGSSSGSGSGYMTSFVYSWWRDDPGYHLRLEKYIDDSHVTLGEADINDPTDKWWWVRLKIEGDDISCRMWEHGTPEPSSWLISVTDTEFDEGWFGVGTYNDSLAEWDYLSVGTEGVEPYVPEQVVTLSPEEVGETTAKMRGEVISFGEYDSADVFFEYRKVGASNWEKTSSIHLDNPGEFAIQETDLEAGNEYEYRAVAQLEHTVFIYGEIETFTLNIVYKTYAGHVVSRRRAETPSGDAWRFYKQGTGSVSINDVTAEVRSYDEIELTFITGKEKRDKILDIASDAGDYVDVSTSDGGFYVIDTSGNNNRISAFPPAIRRFLRSETEWIVKGASDEAIDQSQNKFEMNLTLIPLRNKVIRAEKIYPEDVQGTGEWLFDFEGADVSVSTDRVTADITSEMSSFATSYTLSIFLVEGEAAAFEDVLQKLDAVAEDEVMQGSNDVIDTTRSSINTLEVTSPGGENFEDGKYIVTLWETEWFSDASYLLRLGIAK